jgi:hypothetical protein
MAQEFRRFAVTIPAGTAKSAHASYDLSFGARIVRKIEIRVPPGPRGEVGFAIGAAGQAVLPVQAGQYIVTDDEVIPWELDGFWDSGSWTMFAYNTGVFDHTLEVRFEVDVPQEVGGAGAVVVPSLVGVSSGG